MNSVIAHKEESHDKMNHLIGQTIVQIVFIPKAYLSDAFLNIKWVKKTQLIVDI